MSDSPAEPRWRVLFTPRWLSWHLFAVAAFAGMLWLGDWQFRRAMAGNPLSWAYTFEWPVFAVFGAVFWAKTVKDELRPARPAEAGKITLPASASSPDQADSILAAAAERQPGHDQADDIDDTELAEYNAYLAMLGREAGRHGTRHGLRSPKGVAGG